MCEQLLDLSTRFLMSCRLYIFMMMIMQVCLIDFTDSLQVLRPCHDVISVIFVTIISWWCTLCLWIRLFNDVFHLETSTFTHFIGGMSSFRAFWKVVVMQIHNLINEIATWQFAWELECVVVVLLFCLSVSSLVAFRNFHNYTIITKSTRRWFICPFGVEQKVHIACVLETRLSICEIEGKTCLCRYNVK